MKTILPAQLHELLASSPGLTVLDVRTPAEYAEAHVPGVRNIPLNILSPKGLVHERIISENEPVYLVCRSGARAEMAAEKFARDNIDNAVVVEGGTLAWSNAGLPLKRGPAQAISLERQVRIAAGFLVLLGLLLAYFVHIVFVGLAAFVGAGLVFAGITDFCGMGLLLAKLPWNNRTGA